MEALKQKENKMFTIRSAERIVLFLLIVMCFEFFMFQTPTLASEQPVNDFYQKQEEVIKATKKPSIRLIERPLEKEAQAFPDSEDLEVSWTGYYTVTAYNSDAAQTDSTPCITANGFDLCKHGIEDSIAANFLKYGTKVKMPDVFGDRVFVVRDRMNKRYQNRIDVWMKDKQDAKKFGVRIVKIEVLAPH